MAPTCASTVVIFLSLAVLANCRSTTTTQRTRPPPPQPNKVDDAINPNALVNQGVSAFLDGLIEGMFSNDVRAQQAADPLSSILGFDFVPKQRAPPQPLGNSLFSNVLPPSPFRSESPVFGFPQSGLLSQSPLFAPSPRPSDPLTALLSGIGLPLGNSLAPQQSVSPQNNGLLSLLGSPQQQQLPPSPFRPPVIAAQNDFLAGALPALLGLNNPNPGRR